MLSSIVRRTRGRRWRGGSCRTRARCQASSAPAASRERYGRRDLRGESRPRVEPLAPLRRRRRGSRQRLRHPCGLVGLLAGAFSMAPGEYISVRVQREVFERLIHLEAHVIGSNPDAERAELAEPYLRRGPPGDVADRVAEHLMNARASRSIRTPARSLGSIRLEDSARLWPLRARRSRCSRSAHSCRWFPSY